MDFKLLKPFIEKSAASQDVKVKTAATDLLSAINEEQEAEEILNPRIHAQPSGNPLDQRLKDEVDLKLNSWMADTAEKELALSQFGKSASSYSADVTVASLPKETQQDVLKFTPSVDKNDKVVQYGMVTDELLPKVDQHNWEKALKHISAERKKNKRELADRFQKKIDNKYILLMNDNVVDGHHFLAMAHVLGISCSLKVLDLTPLRFQSVKVASLYKRLSYGLRKHSRKGAVKAL